MKKLTDYRYRHSVDPEPNDSWIYSDLLDTKSVNLGSVGSETEEFGVRSDPDPKEFGSMDPKRFQRFYSQPRVEKTTL
uniref:Uncharacterized protein n=1 Tax=Acrobeloides nanus TaxID=290746 RepID=A0A914EG08_9BILA